MFDTRWMSTGSSTTRPTSITRSSPGPVCTRLIYVAGRGGLKLLMPDGTGFGASTVSQHRYLMGEVEGRTAIDMWTAVQRSREFLDDPPQGDLHIFGLSAGALPALWAQRLYEADGGTPAEVTLMGAVTAVPCVYRTTFSGPLVTGSAYRPDPVTSV